MPQVAVITLNNGVADKVFTPAATKGASHDQGFRDLTVSPAICQPQITIATTITDTRFSVREKITRPLVGTDASARKIRVGTVEVDISLRADLAATETEISEALHLAMESLKPTAPVTGAVFYKGESLW